MSGHERKIVAIIGHNGMQYPFNCLNGTPIATQLLVPKDIPIF